ncbi:Hsp20/alpha crystallin family protein [uncultured Microscilla sp.]|uniref:Hsp20/alpha crystallin family protein n=1 Tax=uncultured Microscilla sp. TaxID=432653 RepID=UPI002615105C|nr:Hsp20/alpha crystallin family protein [uncultured Microscilla sp.]
MSILPEINRTFHRIGDRFGEFIDKKHFMGRTPFQDNWMAPDKKTAYANIKSDEKAYTIEVGLPGYDKEDVKIDIDQDMLHVRAEKQYKDDVKTSEFLRQEFCHESMFRSFRLRPNIDAENIKATFENGLLTLTLPQKYQPNTKHIEIK